MQRKSKNFLLMVIFLLLAVLLCASQSGSQEEKVLQAEETAESIFSSQLQVGGSDVLTEPLVSLQEELQEMLAARKAQWSVTVVDLECLQMLVCDNAGTAAEETVAASLIKLYILATACEQIESGALPETAALQSHLYDMIVYSSNEDANAVLRVIGEGDTAHGMGRVNDWCRLQGYTATRINRRLGITAYSEENYTSAVDCAHLLTAIATGTCVSAEQSQYMLSLLQKQTLTWKIPAGIPRQSGVRIGNKTGELANLAEHDAAIVIGSDLRYVLCVLCEYPGRETDAVETIAEISACVYRSFSEAADKS